MEQVLPHGLEIVQQEAVVVVAVDLVLVSDQDPVVQVVVVTAVVVMVELEQLEQLILAVVAVADQVLVVVELVVSVDPEL